MQKLSDNRVERTTHGVMPPFYLQLVRYAGEKRTTYSIKKGIPHESSTVCCPKCEGEMEQRFILDISPNLQLVSRWAAGVPQKSFWTGTKTVPEENLIPVGSFRCASCGFLEFYARPEFAEQ